MTCTRPAGSCCTHCYTEQRPWTRPSWESLSPHSVVLGMEYEEPTLTQELCPFQSLMLAKAKECWEQEHEEREAEKVRYLAERIPTLQTRGLSLSALQVSLVCWTGLGASCLCGS